MAAFDVKIVGGEVLRARNNHWFYFISDSPLGPINSYLAICRELNNIKKGGLHITTKYNDLNTAVRFIPGHKILEIIRTDLEGD